MNRMTQTAIFRTGGSVSVFLFQGVASLFTTIETHGEMQSAGGKKQPGQVTTPPGDKNRMRMCITLTRSDRRLKASKARSIFAGVGKWSAVPTAGGRFLRI